MNGTLLFGANDGNNGFELWKSDGTESGTVLVKDIRPGSGFSNPSDLTNVNGTLFFSANDGVSGVELWKSDGTDSGTFRVKDARPGSLSFLPQNLTNMNGTLFFRAYDDSNGWELWKSDGTDSGTVLVEDIRAGSGSSSPSDLTNGNGTLFFTANDGSNGFELWALGPALFGTSGDDTITVKITENYLVTINGQTYVYPIGELTLQGNGGTDTIVVVGTVGDQTLFASPDFFELTGFDFRLTGEEIEHLTVRGNGGNDVATLLDSGGNERAVAKVNNTFVRDLARTFSQRVIDFGEVTLVSTGSAAGNFDLANLFDSVAADVFVGHSGTASMTSAGYIVRTSGYDRNVARSRLGGQDVAILHGTAQGNENFTARVTANPANNFGLLRSGPGASLPFLNRAIGFSSVSGRSNGGDDKAYFFDGSGNDLLLASASLARLLGSGYEFEADAFQRVNSMANVGGNDEAILVDGTGDDRLVGTKNRATLYGESNLFIHSTIGFERVTGDASEGGIDRLVLYSDITFEFFELGTWEL
ncbi:MAG: ELWxxDGT repeat protein [Planctomycetota bacterium]|nr:ELWxxDGT repeat protein [Planctomycetota bacterium]